MKIKTKNCLGIFAIFLFCLACKNSVISHPEPIAISGNPILPGDFADPCILQYNDTFYIYATTWDNKDAIVWYSSDFQDWKMKKLNWPTTAVGSYIWAPSIVQGKDGRFYFYSSVQSNIYAGVSDHPMGPFRNLLPDEKSMIKNRQYWDDMHTIDADCFIDDDGQAYLYWGSGFEFKNGRCAVAPLNDDMCTFKEEPKLITPSNFFEGAHMVKRNGIYYLMYSDGVFLEDTYKVRYATSDSPMGPFVESETSPILTTTADGLTRSPGHHYTIRLGEKNYIVYHKHAIPVYTPTWGPMRQVCIDELQFDEKNQMKKVVPTSIGIQLDFVKGKQSPRPLKIAAITSSKDNGPQYEASKASDGSFGTLWSAPTADLPVWLKADLGNKMKISSCSPVFDIVDGDYDYIIEYSADDKNWLPYAKGNNSESVEWPIQLKKEVDARYLRIHILNQTKEKNRIGIWEFNIYGK